MAPNSMGLENIKHYYEIETRAEKLILKSRIKN